VANTIFFSEKNCRNAVTDGRSAQVCNFLQPHQRAAAEAFFIQS